MHPFTPDLSAISDKELDEKVQELTKKILPSYAFFS